MQEHGPDLSDVIWKIIINIGGLLIGIGAKMASLYEKNRLDLKRFLIHSTLAICSAWVVYFILDAKGHADWMPIAGPLIGRFGDQVILVIWQAIKERIMVTEIKEAERAVDEDSISENL